MLDSVVETKSTSHMCTRARVIWDDGNCKTCTLAAAAREAFDEPDGDIPNADESSELSGVTVWIPWRVQQRSAFLQQQRSLGGTSSGQLPLTERALKAWSEVSRRILRDPSRVRLNLQNACNVLEVPYLPVSQSV